MFPTNPLNVPEIRNYHREATEDCVIVRYEVREPGEAHWHPVELIAEELNTPVICRECRSSWPRRSTSDPDGLGPICIPCTYPTVD